MLFESELAAARTAIDEGAYAEAVVCLQALAARCWRARNEVSGDDERALLAARSELACHGMGPLDDLLRGAAALLATRDDAPRLLTLGIGRMMAAGARASARRLFEQVERGCRDSAALLAARRCLRGDERRFVLPALASVDALLASGRRASARAEVERLLATELALDERLALHEMSSSLAREELAFAASAVTLERSRRSAPQADGALQLGLKAALDCWAAGEADRARELLRGARERPGESSNRGEAAYLRRVAADVLRDLDRHAPTPAGPRWQLHDDVAQRPLTPRPVLSSGASGALELLCWALGLQGAGAGEGLSTLAQLRRELTARGVLHGRVLLDERRLALALASGALVLLEEERPTSTGWLWLRGFDPVGRLLLVVDPGWAGPLLRPLASQERRGQLFGFGALLVWGPQTEGQRRYAQAAAEGLMHDPRLDLIDRCELDEQGHAPPRARVARLAEEGMRIAPEVPLFCLRRGESLLAQLRAGELEPGPAGPFERWFAAAQRSFPDAGWPYQIYALALEVEGRAEEAGIAWCEAQARDPLDDRNLAGHARALLQMERPAVAMQLLRRAATLAPSRAVIQAEQAQAALACGDEDAAELESELALDLDPALPQALLTRVDVLEARGELTPVIDLLGRASALQPDDLVASRRLLRRHVLLPDWPSARRLAGEQLRAHSQDARAWRDVVWVAWCEADAERALEHALDGLQRVGPDEPLVVLLSQTLVDLLPSTELSGAVDRALTLLCETAPGAIKTVALALAAAGHDALALEAAQRARQAFGDDVNGWWHLCQVLLRLVSGARCATTADDGVVEEALAATQELAPPFAYARIVAAARRLAAGDAAAALALLEAASIEQAPGLIWWLSAQALDGLGQGGKAEQMRARLPEVFPSGVLDHVAFLRQLRLPHVARELLEAMLAHWSRVGGTTERQLQQTLVELGLARAELGDAVGALELFSRVARAPHGVAVPFEQAAHAALRLRRWSELEQLAELGERRALRDSRLDVDIWPLRAARAGACLSRGEAAPREALLRQAPRHPGVWVALVAVEEALGHATAAADRARLAELAPGGALQRWGATP